jgi:hypothetical protein
VQAADVADHRQLNAIRRFADEQNDNWVTSRQLKKRVGAATHLQRTGDGGQSPYLFTISFAARETTISSKRDRRVADPDWASQRRLRYHSNSSAL